MLSVSNLNENQLTAFNLSLLRLAPQLTVLYVTFLFSRGSCSRDFFGAIFQVETGDMHR